MNTETLVAIGSGLAWSSALLTGLYYVVGTNVYELKHSRAINYYKKHPYARNLRKRPLISVIVLAHNNSEAILECLTSIEKNGYRKLQVIVVDNASSDITRQTVRNYKKSSQRITLIALRRHLSTELAVQRASKAVKGDLVILMSGDQALTEKAIQNALIALKHNNRTAGPVSIRQVWRYELKGPVLSIEQVLFGLPKAKWGYIRNRVALTPGIISYKAALSQDSPSSKSGFIVKRLCVISWTILFGYFSYLAIDHRYAVPFALLVASLAVYAGTMVSAQASLKFIDKVKTIITLPASFTILLAMIYFREIKKASRLLTRPFFRSSELKV